MNKTDAIKRLFDWSRRGRYVFTRQDLGRIFFEERPGTVQAGLDRLVRDGLLERPVRKVYVCPMGRCDSYALEHVAKAMRRGEFSYVSLESALSEYGVISQIPAACLTVMTTGRKGRYGTPYGDIEFTHTKRPAAAILAGVRDVGRPLRLATAACALRDLKRTGRDIYPLDEEALQDA